MKRIIETIIVIACTAVIVIGSLGMREGANDAERIESKETANKAESAENPTEDDICCALFEETGDVLKLSKSSEDEEVSYTDFDVDLDGINEIHIKCGTKYYILKEDEEELIVWGEFSSDYEPVEGGILRYESDGDRTEYEYYILSAGGKPVWKISFLKANGAYLCDDVEVSQKQWKQMLQIVLPEERAVWTEGKASVQIVSEEGRTTAAKRMEQKNADRENALALYDQFLRGNYVVKHYHEAIGWIEDTISSYTDVTGEPGEYYTTQAAIVDSDGDGLEELHIRNPREYTVYRYDNGKLVVDQVSEFIDRNDMLMNNGGYLYQYDVSMWGTRTFYFFGNGGQILLEVDFSMECPEKELFVQSEPSVYTFMTAEVTKAQYEELTKRYYDIGSDEIAWETIAEETENHQNN